MNEVAILRKRNVSRHHWYTKIYVSLPDKLIRILLSQLRSFQIILYALRKISFELAHGAKVHASDWREKKETENKEREEDGSKKEKG